MILVSKSYLPVRKSLEKYIDRIYASNWLTNFGQLEAELSAKLKDFLGLDNLLLTANGTLALQVIYKALNLSGEVITTPFSFAGTTSSLVWDGLKPVFADIEPVSLNIDYQLIEDKITHKTSAILPVHVFGRPCNLGEISKIADRHKLRLIYDAAHAFNVRLQQGESILNYGDASILSFHATKIFHTIEGGAIISRDSNFIKECRKLINFGITGPDCVDGVGINAKLNEFSAAMGLAVLDNINMIIENRAEVSRLYKEYLPKEVLLQDMAGFTQSYAYFPILLANELQCLRLKKALEENQIMPRRYFYPPLDTLNYVDKQYCPISRDISSRILCLPFYESLANGEIRRISEIVLTICGSN